MSDENEVTETTEGQDMNDLPEEIRNLPPDELRYLQLVATLQKIASDVQGWLARAEQALHNHNLRMNVLETLICHPDFKEQREKFFAGTLVLEDLQKIANDYIQPELQKRAEEMQKAREAHFAKQAAAQQQAGSAIIDPNTGRPANEKPTLLTPDGRQVIIRED